jgi:hypothetical protein
MTRHLTRLKNGLEQRAIRTVLKPLVDRFSSQPLTSAGLAISSGGATTAKTGASTFYASAAGVLVSIAAGNYNVACFFVNSGGTVTVGFGTQGGGAGQRGVSANPGRQCDDPVSDHHLRLRFYRRHHPARYRHHSVRQPVGSIRSNLPRITPPSLSSLVFSGN